MLAVTTGNSLLLLLLTPGALPVQIWLHTSVQIMIYGVELTLRLSDSV